MWKMLENLCTTLCASILIALCGLLIVRVAEAEKIPAKPSRELIQPEIRTAYDPKRDLVDTWWRNTKGQVYWVERSLDGGKTWHQAIEHWPWQSRARTLHVHTLEASTLPDYMMRVITQFD